MDDSYYLNQLPKNSKGLTLSNCFEVFNKRFDVNDYRPITAFSLALEQYITENSNPTISHCVNIILFGILVLFLYHLLIAILGTEYVILAFLCCLLFIAHPIHSNVVSSIKNRDILFSFLFSCCSVLFFLKFILNKHIALRKAIGYLLLAVISFFIAQLSKIDSYWVPFVLAFYTLYQHKEILLKREIKNIVLLLSPILALILFNVLLTSIVQQNLEEKISNAGVKMLFTENPMGHYGWWGKLFYVVVSIFMYAKFFIVPFGYYFYFGYKQLPLPHLFHPYFILGIITIFCYLFILWYAIKNQLKPIIISLLFIGISIAYALNIITPVSGIVDSRYAFHASAGFCLFIASSIYFVSERLHQVINKPMWSINKITVSFTLLLMLLYSIFTFNRNKDWKNIFTLIESDMPMLPFSFQANRIASYHCLEQVKYEQDNNNRYALLLNGLNYAKNAVRIDPENLSTQEGVGIAYNLLGYKDSAFHQFNYIINKFDTSEVAWDMLGDFFYEKGKKDSALHCFINTIRVSPLYDRPYYKYTVCMMELNKAQEAKNYFSSRIKQNPNQYFLYDNIGYLYLSEHDTATAVDYYSKAYELGLKDMSLFVKLSNFVKTNKDASFNEKWILITNKLNMEYTSSNL